MSLESPTISDAQTAANHGIGSFRHDFEVAEDLGIATDPETVARHFAAGQEVGRLMGAAEELPSTNDPDRQQWKDSFHFSHPASEFPNGTPIPRASAEQQAVTSAETLRLGTLIRSTGDRPR